MKDSSPFGIADIWENWKDPASVNGFGRLPSSPPARTSYRMPVILAPADYARWLSEGTQAARSDATVPGSSDADVADLDSCQRAGERRPSIIEPIELATDAA